MTTRALATMVMLLLVAAAAGRAQGAAGGPLAYLGQPPPGNVPRVFAPGVVSRGNIHSRLTISPDGREILWTTVDMATFSTRILSVRETGARWTAAAPPSFAAEGDTKDPVFSADGTRLYYLARVGDRWVTRYVEPAAGGWSAPRESASPFNVSSSFTRSGRVYCSSQLKTKVWETGIFSGRYGEAGLSDLAPLDAAINLPGGIDYTPYVAPDESFLLFSSNRPVVGEKEDMHIHVAFRARDGAWSAPRRVFDIAGRFPSLSPDGRYLFFCGDDGNIYWVDVRVLEPLRRAAK
jgi:hypothetical protein